MPHQCVKCGRLFEDASGELLKGCRECGGKFFFFVKKEELKKAEEIQRNLSPEERVQMEEDSVDLIGNFDKDKPVILDLETIRVLQPGKYELDLVDLFKGKPLVYRLEEGKYIIDIGSTFDSLKDEKV
jgi:predicted  nucleic acid-binding Zn-ribbon protein